MPRLRSRIGNFFRKLVNNDDPNIQHAEEEKKRRERSMAEFRKAQQAQEEKRVFQNF